MTEFRFKAVDGRGLKMIGSSGHMNQEMRTYLNDVVGNPARKHYELLKNPAQAVTLFERFGDTEGLVMAYLNEHIRDEFKGTWNQLQRILQDEGIALRRCGQSTYVSPIKDDSETFLQKRERREIADCFRAQQGRPAWGQVILKNLEADNLDSFGSLGYATRIREG